MDFIVKECEIKREREREKTLFVKKKKKNDRRRRRRSWNKEGGAIRKYILISKTKINVTLIKRNDGIFFGFNIIL